MKWLILSDNSPSNLARILRSAGEHMANTMPIVLMRCNDSTRDEYLKLTEQFTFKGRLWTTDTFRFHVSEILEEPKTSGALDPMTLITPDCMVFCKRFDPYIAWMALEDRDVAGLALTLSWPPPQLQVQRCATYREVKITGHKNYVPILTEILSWSRAEATGPYADGFEWGTVCRTSDVLAGLRGMKHQTAMGLWLALQNAQDASKRPKLACLTDCHLTYPKE